MKNKIFFILDSKIRLSIKGNNIERFIKRLKTNNIDILNIKYIDSNNIIIDIYYKDYEKLLKIKTVYEVDVITYKGLKNIKEKIFNNKYIIISILICMIFLYILSNIVFNIEVITNDTNMKQTLLEELDENGLKKYNFKKSYLKIQDIKQNIMDKHKDDIEWLEIENIGTKYIIRYEPRIKNDIKIDTPNRNIIAKKDAIITSMDIEDGSIVKDIHSYVKKGDVIVSGYITLNDNIKDMVSASGNVYGEVWYEVSVKYPFNYYENIETGKSSNIFCIHFLNKKIEIFGKYKTKNVKEKIIVKNNVLPIYISIENQRETNEIKETNDKNSVIDRAVNKAREKIESNLKNDEYIKDYKIMSTSYDKTGVNLRIFFTVVENITDYQNIY